MATGYVAGVPVKAQLPELSKLVATTAPDDVFAEMRVGYPPDVSETTASTVPPKSSRTTSEFAGSVTVPLVPELMIANRVVLTYLSPMIAPTVIFFVVDVEISTMANKSSDAGAKRLVNCEIFLSIIYSSIIFPPSSNNKKLPSSINR